MNLRRITPSTRFSTRIQAVDRSSDGSNGNDRDDGSNDAKAVGGAALLILPLLFQHLTSALPASAAGFGSFTPEQRFVAEAWRTVDNAYIDRTFNHQDWLKLRRQDAISRKYRSMDEARVEVEGMLGRLSDRYTRYLPPAKYDSIVNAATGNVYGVGVELAQNKEGMRVIASDVEPNGPASAGGLMPGDVFLEVDGVRFDDGRATPDGVAVVVRGPEGSKVGMVMERDGKTVDFILTRAGGAARWRRVLQLPMGSEWVGGRSKKRKGRRRR